MLRSCDLCSILEINRIGREMTLSCMTRRWKGSGRSCGIGTRLPLHEGAKSERDDWGWSFKMTEHF